MYDILQLNDMLVPELLDIAEQLKITGAKKLEKQELVYKILDKQAITAKDTKSDEGDDGKTKRKRIIKTSTANSTEEAIVESGDEKPKKAEIKKAPPKKEEKPVVLKKVAGRKKEEEEAAPAPVAKAAPRVQPAHDRQPQDRPPHERTARQDRPERPEQGRQ